MVKRLLLLYFWLWLACLAGCSPSSSPSPTSSSRQDAAGQGSPAAGGQDIKHIDASRFSFEDYLPPLDGGRIELAPPAGWRAMPRNSKFIVRFYKSDPNSLPRIHVKVEEHAVGGMTDVTEANVKTFAKEAFKELESEGAAIVEPPVPMVIGDLPCARYVTNLRIKLNQNTIPVERESLQVLKAGRLYTIELLYLPRTLKQVRGNSFDPAYAVCASMKFLKAESDDSTATSE